MMADDRKARLDAASAEQFSALGEFIQDFELVCFALKPLFVFSFHRHGLTGTGQPLANIAIDNHYMTAEPLVSIVAAVYRQAIKGDDVAAAVMSDVEKRFKALIEVRNRAVHGTFLIGWVGSDQEDFDEIMGVYNKLTKTGLEPRDMPKSAAELRALSEEAKDIADLARRLMIPLAATEEIMRGDGQFVRDEDKWRSKIGRGASGSDANSR